MSGPKIRRLYYSAKEVSDETGFTAMQLRALEARFPEIKPVRHRSGRRLYRPSDLKRILEIHELMSQGHDEERIAELVPSQTSLFGSFDHRDAHVLLLEVMAELEEIRDLLGTQSHQFPP